MRVHSPYDMFLEATSHEHQSPPPIPLLDSVSPHLVLGAARPLPLEVFAAFNRATVPGPRVERCVRLAAAMLGPAFGCLHARIERDMRRESPEGVPPPSLQAIVRHMPAHPPRWPLFRGEPAVLEQTSRKKV